MAEEKGKSSSVAKERLSKTQIILIAGISLILISIGVVGAMLYNMANKTPEIIYAETETGNYVIDENNLEEIKTRIEEQVKDGMFEVTMNTNWSFPSSSEASDNAYVANAQSNSKPIFFEILLGDTEEVIYTSTVMPVGTSLKKIILDTPLEKGNYAAVCKYNLLNEDGKIASSLSVNVSISIKN